MIPAVSSRKAAWQYQPLQQLTRCALLRRACELTSLRTWVSLLRSASRTSINRARLMRSGFTDVLTGWHNRRYLTVRLSEELARARRDGTRLVCLMLDVDHFKQRQR